ncbi:CRISPR-associated endoribonuclease Cas6 [Persephonella sp.]
MRLRLVLNAESGVIDLPLHHNVTLQGMLYKSLPDSLLKMLEEVGFFFSSSKFKLFTFSRIYSPQFMMEREKKRIKYKTPVTLYLSSGVQGSINLNGTDFKEHIVKLGKNELKLEKVEVLAPPPFGEEIYLKTLSPITVYRTFEKEKKFYRYYKPEEEEFVALLRENLKKKYSILTGEKLEHFPFEIEPFRKVRKVLIKYRDFPIEGYDGIFKVKTDPELFKVVYDAGLGSKNSQGFGMVEAVEPKK